MSVPCDKAHASKIFGSNATSRSLCLQQKTHMPRFTAVDVCLAAAVLPSKSRYRRHTPVNVLSRCVRHTDILPITCCHRMPHCWHIYALTVYNNAVAIVPTWCNRVVRMLLYADVESSFLAARVLSHGVFLLPEYRHSLSNATIVYLSIFDIAIELIKK